MVSRSDLEQGLWLAPEEAGKSVIVERAGLQIAVFFLPSLQDSFILPNTAMRNQIDALAADLKGKSDLLIGISPWGAQGERFYLENGNPRFDILLGAGNGPGLNGQLLNKGKTLWVRPYTKGQAVQKIEVLASAVKNPETAWKIGANMTFASLPLRETMPEDSETQTVLQGLE
ncbi:MAG: hypothetical protein ACOC24_02885 [Desulfovibrionales bacterium]